jgi:hypothetical protein
MNQKDSEFALLRHSITDKRSNLRCHVTSECQY